MQPVSECQNPKNITSTTTVVTGPCGLLGIFVSSVSGSPTLKVSDGTTTLVNTFTPTAATWYPLPAKCATSLVITVGATLDACVFWNG